MSFLDWFIIVKYLFSLMPWTQSQFQLVMRDFDEDFFLARQRV